MWLKLIGTFALSSEKNIFVRVIYVSKCAVFFDFLYVNILCFCTLHNFGHSHTDFL